MNLALYALGLAALLENHRVDGLSLREGSQQHTNWARANNRPLPPPPPPAPAPMNAPAARARRATAATAVKYYVSYATGPWRYQISTSSAEPHGWTDTFSFYAFSSQQPGTTKYYVSYATGPWRYKVSTSAQCCGWTDSFSFYAFSSQQPDTTEHYVADAPAPHRYRVSTSSSGSAQGWTNTFSFHAFSSQPTTEAWAIVTRQIPSSGHHAGDAMLGSVDSCKSTCGGRDDCAGFTELGGVCYFYKSAGPLMPHAAANWHRNPTEDDSFTAIFLSDMETGYRHHTVAEAEHKVQEIIKLTESGSAASFDGKYSHVKIDPKIVLHGGDINGDGFDYQYGTCGGITSLSGVAGFIGGSHCKAKNVEPGIWAPLYEKNIPFVSAAGNHDGAADSQSRVDSTAFVKQTYAKAASQVPGFSYTEVSSPSSVFPVFKATFKGVQIANFQYRATAADITAMEAELDKSKTTLVVSHLPVSHYAKTAHLTEGHTQGWAQGYQTSDTQALKNFMNGFTEKKAAVFSGHTHTANAEEYGNWWDYTAPYPHPWKKDMPCHQHVKLLNMFLKRVMPWKRIRVDSTDVVTGRECDAHRVGSCDEDTCMKTFKDFMARNRELARFLDEPRVSASFKKATTGIRHDHIRDDAQDKLHARASEHGGVLAVLVSPTRGILQVKVVQLEKQAKSPEIVKKIIVKCPSWMSFSKIC